MAERKCLECDQIEFHADDCRMGDLAASSEPADQVFASLFTSEVRE